MRDHAIYKTLLYPDGNGQAEVELPKGALPLAVQYQQGIPAMWWIVEFNEEKEKRVVDFVGTGWKFDIKTIGSYIGTLQHPTGGPALVWHVFVR